VAQTLSVNIDSPGLTVPAFRFLARVRAVHPTSTRLGPAGRSPVRKRHARLRCAEAGQNSLGTNGRSTGLRSQR